MPRPRKSLEDHVRDGTYRADRHGPLPAAVLTGQAKPGAGAATVATVEPASEPPVKPPDLEREVARVWDRLTSLLAHLIGPRDGDLIQQMAWWLVELGRVQATVGKMVPGQTRYKETLQAAATCQDRFEGLAAKFGMSPADRARVRAEAGPPKAKVPVRPKTKLDAMGAPK